MKHVITFWILVLAFFALFFFGCNDSNNYSEFRVKKVDTELIDIKELNSNLQPGDKYKANDGEVYVILNRGNKTSDIVYTDKIQYLLFDSTITKTDTLSIDVIMDTMIIKKHNGEIKTKYILK